MGSLRVTMCLKLALISTLVLCVLPPTTKSQKPGCSFGGAEVDECFNQNRQHLFLDPCCKAVNQAIRDGLHCLCSLLTPNTQQFNTLLSLSLSTCYISIPPLSMCRGVDTMPIPLAFSPMNRTNEIQTAQQNPTPPSHTPGSSAATPQGTRNSDVVERPLHVNKNVTSTMLHVVENGNHESSGSETIVFYCYYCFLLSLLAYYYLILKS